MTDTTTGRGQRVLFIDPSAQAARANSEGRLGRLLIAGALASFLGFFGLAVISTPPSSTSAAVSQPAYSSSAPVYTRSSDDDDDDDDHDSGSFGTSRSSGRSEVRTKTS